ncbi:hypothetical protein GCM10027059_26970 [Myceligenerans halotolerans]
MSSRAWGLIQAHLDRFQVSEAGFARRVGISAQALNSWKRGLNRLPKPEVIAAAAREAQVDRQELLDAFLVDMGHMDPPEAEITVGESEPPPLPERPRNGEHPAAPAAGDTRQAPSRPAHGPNPARVQRAGRTRSHGTK